MSRTVRPGLRTFILRTVSVVRRRPVPKAMAFGGVATGSMNDIEHAIQAGSVK